MKSRGDQIKIFWGGGGGGGWGGGGGGGGEGRDRQTDRQTDRERSYANNCLNVFGLVFLFNGEATKLGSSIMDSFNY